MMTQRRVMMKYGGYSQSAKKRSYFRSFVIPVLFFRRVFYFAICTVLCATINMCLPRCGMVGATDFPKTCLEFAVPYFVFDGVLDQNASLNAGVVRQHPGSAEGTHMV